MGDYIIWISNWCCNFLWHWIFYFLNRSMENIQNRLCPQASAFLDRHIQSKAIYMSYYKEETTVLPIKDIQKRASRVWCSLLKWLLKADELLWARQHWLGYIWFIANKERRNSSSTRTLFTWEVSLCAWRHSFTGCLYGNSPETQTRMWTSDSYVDQSKAVEIQWARPVAM